ncbi:hypothetical protein Aph01nite_00050 [Acrocarpospora phusangensis]|uniref:Uncharacterized protein n=1 Tax=Acrocarpospora phusangensis TaxID=1070424 RepID=A0A919UMF2_9ACTN|nr:hypothetical protein [Acrocarpospora phusangensis]GIH21695.1 hypothetical protein Aph01nite_00050 [Acrocarpospora phusangensis]
MLPFDIPGEADGLLSYVPEHEPAGGCHFRQHTQVAAFGLIVYLLDRLAIRSVTADVQEALVNGLEDRRSTEEVQTEPESARHGRTHSAIYIRAGLGAIALMTSLVLWIRGIPNDPGQTSEDRVTARFHGQRS